MGIAARPEQLHFAGTFRTQYEKSFHGAVFRDNEITWIYVYREPVALEALSLQAEEVDEVRWFDLEQVQEEILRSRERLCVPSGGLAVLRRYLESNS